MASSFRKPRSNPRVLFYAGCEDVLSDRQPLHLLESCFLCHKTLRHNNDIFMYRGSTPFCSEECRQEQIERDEAKESLWNLSASLKAVKKPTTETPLSNKNSGSSAKSVQIRGATVAVA